MNLSIPSRGEDSRSSIQRRTIKHIKVISALVALAAHQNNDKPDGKSGEDKQRVDYKALTARLFLLSTGRFFVFHYYLPIRNGFAVDYLTHHPEVRQQPPADRLFPHRRSPISKATIPDAWYFTNYRICFIRTTNSSAGR